MTKKFFAIILLTTILSSCEYTFPGFEDTLVLSWLPYKTGDLIKYSNSTDTISFNVIKDYITPKSVMKTDFPVMDIFSVEPVAFYESNKDDKTGLFIREYCQQDCYLSIRFVENDSTVLPYVYLQGYQSDTLNSKLKIIYHNKFKIDKAEYVNVYEIKKDTVDNNIRIWRVLLTQNYGVILFNDRSLNKEWRLIK